MMSCSNARNAKLQRRDRTPDQQRDLRKICVTFYLVANCTDFENVLFAKRLLSYEANIRLQNSTNADHVRLKTDLQPYFEKVP